MRKSLFALLVLGIGSIAVGCMPAQKKEAAETTCPDDGPRLKHTGLCQGRSVNYLDPSLIITSEAPEGCTWTMNDAAFGPGDEALLYQAMSCEGRTTELEVRGGAGSASIGYVTSGFFKDIPADYETARVFTLDGVTDPKAMILNMAKETTADKKEAAGCVIRELKANEGPAGAFVVDASEAYRKANKIVTPKDEPAGEGFCGDYGYISDGARFWKVIGGYAWLFDFGQDTPDYDPGSMVLMRKDAGGNWAVVP